MADDQKVTESRPVAPLTIPIVAMGDASRLPRDVEIETPGAHQPNVKMRVVQPVVAIAIRFTNTFLTTLLGIVLGGMSSNIIPFSDFQDLLLKSCGLALTGATVGMLKDLVTIFGRLEQKNPILTGNV